MSSSAPNLATLKGREIVVAVCGGIAAYKVADLVSKLVQAGAGVTACMTDNARQFVTPLTFQALTHRAVHTTMWPAAASPGASALDHLGLTENADLMLIAPATADIIAKAACGIADDLVSTMICASACPVVFAPAMNTRMWQNPICKENVAKLQKLGYRFIGPESGFLAERTTGPGRLAEPQTILAELAVQAWKDGLCDTEYYERKRVRVMEEKRKARLEGSPDTTPPTAAPPTPTPEVIIARRRPAKLAKRS
jgi:phosphopantothenoylcysteine decarboxylase/phosphopantothenate--cysteine ligase